jgi:hypothetical protein
MHGSPSTDLIRVFPNAKEGTDVFGQPNEKADQHKCQQQRHVVVTINRLENDIDFSGLLPANFDGTTLG